MTPNDRPSSARAAEILRAAISAVEANGIPAATGSDAAALAGTLQRIAAACPGELAVSVRPAVPLSPADTPLHQAVPPHPHPAHTETAHADPAHAGAAHTGTATGPSGTNSAPAASSPTNSARMGTDTDPADTSSAPAPPSPTGTAHTHLSDPGHSHTGAVSGGSLTGEEVFAALAWNEDVEMPLASVGKLLLLAEVARGVDGGTLDPEEPVRLHEDDYCGGSGLLTGLSARTWTVGDLALLTAAVSDNTATNALLRHVGLDRVNAGARALGLTRTRLLDRIREPRGPEHPPAFAVGTARELAGLVAGAAGWQRVMRGWMLANTDHGLVPALVRHDPEGRRLANKTGTDDGVRSDAGIIGSVAYAVLACGPAGSDAGLARAVRQAGALVVAASGTLP